MNSDVEQFSEERLKELANYSHKDIAALARIALSAKQAKPVAWLLSGGGAKNIVSFDSGNAYADPLREVTPLYTNPQQNHTEQTNPAYWITYYPNPDPNEFDDREHSRSGAKSCAARIAGEIGGFIVPVYHGTPQPAHTGQDGWITIPKDMLADYRDVKNAEVENYKAGYAGYYDQPGTRWARDFADLTEELAEIDALLAAAPKPESE